MMTFEGLGFDRSVAERYISPSQRVRVMSEDWVSRSIYCPNCGHSRLAAHKNNSPVADFYCENCREEFELKSLKHGIGKKVVDGAYETMIGRLRSGSNPSLFLLKYDLTSLSVSNFLVIPKHFFTHEIIEKRKPLAVSARRAGWVGCNIMLESIPQSGRISLVRDSIVQPKTHIMHLWKHTCFLKNQAPTAAKGWLLSVMKCVEDIGTERFTLADVYAFEASLRHTYPGNRHIKEKIRQQLQVLRDNGYLRFLSKGLYEMVHPPPFARP